MTNEEEYISLQLSPFYVRCDEDYHCHVYVRGQKRTCRSYERIDR